MLNFFNFLTFFFGGGRGWEKVKKKGEGGRGKKGVKGVIKKKKHDVRREEKRQCLHGSHADVCGAAELVPFSPKWVHAADLPRHGYWEQDNGDVERNTRVRLRGAAVPADAAGAGGGAAGGEPAVGVGSWPPRRGHGCGRRRVHVAGQLRGGGVAVRDAGQLLRVHGVRGHEPRDLRGPSAADPHGHGARADGHRGARRGAR